MFVANMKLILKILNKYFYNMELYPKFVIEDGALIISKVTYHREIVTDKAKCVGGGWFKFISESNTFMFFGSSDEFGTASFENIQKCVTNKQVYKHKGCRGNISNDYKFVYKHLDGTLSELN